MSFQDKSIQCSDCGTTFTFSAEHQEFFRSKGYTNEPKRCPECRQAKKSERYGNSSSGAPHQMFPATCTECGRTTVVPFQPRGDKPVYCSNCYLKGCSLQYALNQRATSRYIAATASVR